MKWDGNANQWRRDLGYKTTKSGAIGQHRFRFGSDEKPAQLAENRLVAFWDALEGFYASERKERCLWEDWSLQIANEIKDGKINVLVPDPPPALFDGLGLTLDETRPLWSEMLTRYFGNVCGFVGAPVADGYQGQGVYAPVKKANSSGQTLFYAIEAYVDHLHLTHKGV